MKRLLAGCLLSLLSLSGAELAVAAACTTYDSGPIDTGDVTITSAAVASSGTQVFAGSLSATDCAGFFSGNDMPLPSTNIGGRYDGLLNEASQTGGITDPLLDPINTVFTPGAFIDASDLQNLDGIDQGATEATKNTPDGNLVDDPGWIYLGKDDANGAGFDLESPAGINLSLFMDIDFSCAGGGDLGFGCQSGTWSLTFTDPQGLLDALALTVFGDSFFDHLAFVLKAGSGVRGNGGFGVYDFDFNIVNALLAGAFDLNTPHNFVGTWSTEGFLKDISHASLWVRDPSDSTTEVPEPTPLLLIGLALFLLASCRRKIAAM